MTALCAALILMGGFFCPCLCTGRSRRATRRGRDQRQRRDCGGKKETPPLTPKGNATLVDDYGGNKQLITVTTKGGNYFYILIDRAAEGEQTVHFLNQVDEADLMALTENGEAAKKAGNLQLYGKMRSRKGKHVLPGMCNQYDRLHRQRTYPNTNGAAGRTEKKKAAIPVWCLP